MITPVAVDRFSYQIMLDQEAHDLMGQARDLLSHQIPSGDVAEITKRALKLLVRHLERRKYAATEKPRRPESRRVSHDPRHIPAHVKRAVRERDGGRCTYVSEDGHRCSSRRFLELDHVIPVACGGESTVENLRQRCRSHNALEAERVFGAQFMAEKRAAAQAAAEEVPAPKAAAEAKAEDAARAEAGAREEALAREQAGDVFKALRNLGYRADEAKRAAAYSETVACTTLEQRLRAGLRYLCPIVKRERPPAETIDART